MFGRDGWAAGQHPPVIEQRKQARFTSQSCVGDDPVGGQFAPAAEPGTADAAHAVLAEQLAPAIEAAGEGAERGREQ
jgi:hypothetical protein